MMIADSRFEQLYNGPVSLTEWRQQRLSSICSRLTEQHMPLWKKVYISQQRQYVFCCVPKVGCTSWKEIMMRISKADVQRAQEYSHTQRHTQLKNVSLYKFMFVREPLERLASAYRNKCLRDPFYTKILARAILKSRKVTCAGKTEEHFVLQ